ncbi:MAG: homoserine dehydrogenase [Firmicutes bacterium]|nr:homoserine dehydrogenase [Bacillota bacterium]
MKLALIGCGNVGKALIDLLAMKKDYLIARKISLTLCCVLDSKGGIYDDSGIDWGSLSKHLERQSLGTHKQYAAGGEEIHRIIQNMNIDTAVVATPTNKQTGEPGLTYIKALLKRGINVVTADKGPILLAYHALYQMALAHNAKLCIGCTTGGALPSVNAGLIDLAGADIYKIQGILNGTTNFILDEMEKHSISYEKALEKAQHLGIAETDPSLDVEGWDTAVKLLILTNVLMGSHKTLEDISVQGITGLTVADIIEARKKGEKFKLIGSAVKEDNAIRMRVGLEAIDNSNAFYRVDGKDKAVTYCSDTLGELTIIGGASGVIPAAASLLRDIINL